MGFGLLFFGYFLSLPTFANLFFTLPFGAGLMIWACIKLSRVNRPFIRGFFAACGIVPFAVTASVLRLIDATEWLAPYFETFTLILWMLLHIFVLTGLEWVAHETRLPKLRARAFRNKIFSLIYLIPMIGLTITEIFTLSIPAGGQAFLNGFSIAIMVVGLIVMLLNLLAFYSAYMHICMPEDVNMPQKPSRFEFVNRRREEEDRREAENSAALEEARERRRKMREEKRNQKKNKK